MAILGLVVWCLILLSVLLDTDDKEHSKDIALISVVWIIANLIYNMV